LWFDGWYTQWISDEDDDNIHGAATGNDEEGHGGDEHFPEHDEGGEDVGHGGEDQDAGHGQDDGQDEEDQDAGHGEEDQDARADGTPSGSWVQNPYVQALLLKQTSNARDAAREKAYAHTIFCQGANTSPEPLNVMDYIYKEMYECIVNKKTPMYAPYIMKLIIAQQTNHPLLKANLTQHKVVKLQRKGPTGHSTVPFAPMIGEEGDIEEVEAGVFKRRGPRMKHANNAFSSSKEEVAQEYKRLNWFQRNVLCMNVDIRHKQYDSYVAQKHMNDNQQALHKAFRATRLGYVESAPSTPSSDTYSYGKWSKGFADWQAFDDDTSHLTEQSTVDEGKKPMGDEDEDEDFDVDASNEDVDDDNDE
jgi:hypothetical protein